MALTATTWPTLIDVASRINADGSISKIAEILTQSNPILQDMPIIEGNDGAGNKTTMRSGLPTVAWRMINQGIQPSKSTTVQQKDTCGMLEAYAEVDKALVQISNNQAEFRLSESVAFLEAMNQAMAQTLFYGNTSVNPERFLGLSPRYSTITGAANGQNVVDGGGTGSNNASVWLICWGQNTITAFAPKGFPTGLQHQDLGETTIENVNGVANTRMQGYRDHFVWTLGLSVRDWRYAVRIANIDIPALVANAGAQAKLINLMIKAYHRIPNWKMGRCVWYMNRTVAEFLDIQRLDKAAGAGLQYADVDGEWVPIFRGFPIRIIDSLLNTEARVV